MPGVPSLPGYSYLQDLVRRALAFERELGMSLTGMTLLPIGVR